MCYYQFFKKIMSNHYFKFKQFTIYQEKTAMKVGTDGILLGAWADVYDTQKCLDIGTGTGLISLILAQKSKVFIDAIEIENEAFEQAKENISKSNFEKQIKVFFTDFQSFFKKNKTKYDVIISNPPYFKNSLKSNIQARKLARHNDTLSFEDILEGTSKLLNNNGIFYLILPYSEKDFFIKKAEFFKLFLQKATNVQAIKNKKYKRILLAFGKEKQTEIRENNIAIKDENNINYTSEFKNLTKDLYLFF